MSIRGNYPILDTQTPPSVEYKARTHLDANGRILRGTAQRWGLRRCAMLRNWSNIVTISCLIAASIVLAVNQALSGAPNIRPHLPDFITSPNVNYVPLALLVIAGVTWLLGHRHRVKPLEQTTERQNQPSAANPAQFANVDEFYRTYDNQLLREAEQVFRTAVNNYRPEDREGILIRICATIFWTGVFENNYCASYGSQLKALHDLNERPAGMRIEALRPYYSAGLETVPPQ
jgi:hypothetical protein